MATKAAMERLEGTIEAIAEPDAAIEARTRARLDSLTKPVGSLGRLEELARRIVAMRGGKDTPFRGKRVIVMAADHGVTQEGVSAYPVEVTSQMVLNFLRGGAGINVLARHAGAEVVVVDMGVAAEIPAQEGLIRRPVGRGTANFTREPAMTRAAARTSIETGIEIADDLVEAGADLLATGDMGIGNTTAASAVTAVLTGSDPAEVTGRGTGIDDAGLVRKIDVIRRGLSLHGPDPADGLDVLAKVGGFEIGGLAGVILAAAARRVPVVIDGFISGAAALVAASLAPRAKAYMIAGHRSVEKGHRVVLSHLGLKPILDLDLRLGEGTGAALALPIVEASLKILNEMATFASAGVSGRNG